MTEIVNKRRMKAKSQVDLLVMGTLFANHYGCFSHIWHLTTNYYTVNNES